MRHILVLVTLLAGAGCLRQTAFTCDEDADCGTGTCEVVGYCSFVDADCPDGRRFGELSGPHAGACVGQTDMPDAAVEVDAAIDAMIDAPDSPDVDSDGVLNAADNCPAMANANQNNEDGDALGDVCDPCPVSTNNADADGDGVGDACDPRPAIAGDVIALFEGFGQGIPQPWDENGNWTAQMATGEVTGTAPGGAYALLGLTYVPIGQETVSASVTPLDTNGATNRVGVVTNRMPAASQIICALERSGAGTPDLAVFDATQAGASNEVPYELMLNQTYVTRLRRETPNYTCNATRAATTATVMRTHNPVQDPFTLGLVVYGASARYQWLMVVGNP